MRGKPYIPRAGRFAIPAVLGLLLGGCIMSLGIPKQDYQVHPVDLAKVPDGTFRSEYRIVPPFGTFVANRRVSLSVTVLDHRITGIVLGQPAALKEDLDALGRRVIQVQSPALDAVSGATWTKRSYLKAVETALTEAAKGPAIRQ